MYKRAFLARASAGAIGGLLFLGGAGAAIADEVGSDEVTVGVEIEAVAPVGSLTMSIADTDTTLTEVDSNDADVRQFDGVLPTVTITDDREEVPAGVFWYVTGQSSAFRAAGADDIDPGHLGWEPALLTGDDGEVAAGDDVQTVLDPAPNNVGLVSEELLALSLDSQRARPTGQWTANAALHLKTPADVTPGSYSATLTLTLWEDAY